MRHIQRLYDWFAYFNGLREGRNLKPHHVRDGAAFAELCVTLQRRGFEYGRMVPNGPPTDAEFRARLAEVRAARSDGRRHKIEDVVTYRELDDTFLEPGRKLVVPTRPPMDDLDHGDKVHSQPGFTTLEKKIFIILRAYLEICSRAHVRLASAIANQLDADYADRADITFGQVKAPWYKHLTRVDGRRRLVPSKVHKTSAYVFNLEALESLHGADLLVAFGLGGTQTLVLAHRLRNDLAWALDHPGFTMFEMTAPDEATASGGLEFADQWKFDTVLEGVRLPPPSKE